MSEPEPATYRHNWEIGPSQGAVSPINAMRILQDRPNDIFPFLVKGRGGETSIKNGSTYDLINTIGPFDNIWTGSDPVTVVEVTTTMFKFRTHKEHHRGEGQHISFECWERDGKTVLSQYGTYVCSWKRPIDSLINKGANAGATFAWYIQAENLKIALGVSKGTARDIWWWRTQP